jgi:lysophospholipase L1-like esterase
MKSVLCFGDSNTHGTVPSEGPEPVQRWPWAQRWPGVLQGALGANWRVIEEGLPGRTLCQDDPVEGADRAALRYLPACLQSHRPLDAVVFMLGGNDFKARFNRSARDIAQGAHALIDAVRASQLPGHTAPRILLVSPPPVRECGWLSDVFAGAEARSPALADALAQVARSRNVDMLDAGLHVQVSALDGVHLDADAHRVLGDRIARWLRATPNATHGAISGARSHTPFATVHASVLP